MAVAKSLDDLAHQFVGPDEALVARLDHTLDLLAALVQLVPPHAFAWPTAQESLHAALALLAESGRPVRTQDEAKREIANQAWLAARERG